MMTLSALASSQKGAGVYYDKNHHKIVITRNIPECIRKASIIMIITKVCKVSQARARVKESTVFCSLYFFCAFSFLYTFVIIIINKVLNNKINNLLNMMIYYDMMILGKTGK